MTDEQKKSASAEATVGKPAVDESKAAEEKKEEAPKEEVKEETMAADASADVATDDGEEVEVPEKFKSIVEKVEKMSVLDLAELVKILEKKFGVSAAAPAMMMAGAMPGADGGEAAEEKTEFDVELTDFGSNKIAIIKAVRAITEMGLKDAKDIVEAAPKIIKEGIKKEEAEEIKKTFEEAGAKITLK